MIVRGIAIPFDSLASVNGGYEVVRPGALKKMITDRVQVKLQFDHHNDDAPVLASTRDGTLSLFEDAATGLLFEAEIADSDAWTVAAIVSGRHRACSVNFTRLVSGFAMHAGVRARHVVRATIDHIAIAREGETAYRETSCWRSDVPLDQAPEHVRRAASRWERAFQAQVAAEEREADAETRRFGACADRIVAALGQFQQAPSAITFAVFNALCGTAPRTSR